MPAQIPIKMEVAKHQIHVIYKLIKTRTKWFYANTKSHFLDNTKYRHLQSWLSTYDLVHFLHSRSGLYLYCYLARIYNYIEAWRIRTRKNI
jgi:hypothetical protein